MNKLRFRQINGFSSDLNIWDGFQTQVYFYIFVTDKQGSIISTIYSEKTDNLKNNIENMLSPVGKGVVL